MHLKRRSKQKATSTSRATDGGAHHAPAGADCALPQDAPRAETQHATRNTQHASAATPRVPYRLASRFSCSSAAPSPRRPLLALCLMAILAFLAASPQRWGIPSRQDLGAMDPVRAEESADTLTLEPTSVPGLPLAAPEETGADPGPVRKASAAVAAAVRSGRIPGAVFLAGHRGRIIAFDAYGTTAPPLGRGSGVRVTRDTLFDLASLTKVVATTPSVHLLAERGLIDLEAPVARYLPGFAAAGKGGITIAQLLTHSGGLPAGASFGLVPGEDRTSSVMRRIFAMRPTTAPGVRTRYSDLGFITLGEVVRAVSGQRVDEFARENLYRPLGMSDTGYRPLVGERDYAAAPVGRFAATLRGRRGLRGVVQDEPAAVMAGVAGHAGVFSTAGDLAVYAQMILNAGEYGGVRVFQTNSATRMCRATGASADGRRALGWDRTSVYASPKGDLFGPHSFGHTGWTGTSLWIDPDTQAFVVLLTNSANERNTGLMRSLRSRVGTLVARAVGA